MTTTSTTNTSITTTITTETTTAETFPRPLCIPSKLLTSYQAIFSKKFNQLFLHNHTY